MNLAAEACVFPAPTENGHPRAIRRRQVSVKSPIPRWFCDFPAVRMHCRQSRTPEGRACELRRAPSAEDAIARFVSGRAALPRPAWQRILHTTLANDAYHVGAVRSEEGRHVASCDGGRFSLSV
jgi:hypothetical protein